jgi:hypothetical protein
MAYGLSQPILMVVAVYHCYLGTHLKVKDFAQTIAKPILASISAALILIGIDGFIIPNITNLPLSLLIDCVLYGLFYLIIWLTLPGGKRTLLEIKNILLIIKQKSHPK